MWPGWSVCPCGCVFVCVLAVTPASSGGSSGALTVNRSLWASANPLAGARALYHSTIFSFYTHRHRQANKHSHTCIHTYSLSVDQRFQSLPLSLHALSHRLSLPRSLTVGPPTCFTVSRKRVKPVLSFPPLHSKLPGGENRLRCHLLSKFVPTLKWKTNSGAWQVQGDMRTCGPFEQSPRLEMKGCT